MSERVQLCLIAFSGGVAGGLLARIKLPWTRSGKSRIKAAFNPPPPLLIDDIAVDLGNDVYMASTSLFERAEFAGLIRGNGHHMAQELATHAVAMLKAARA